MFHYSAFALNIDSEIELPDLMPGNGDADVIIRRGEVVPRHRHATNEQVFAIRRGVAKFLVRGGKEIIIEQIPGGDPALLRLTLMGKIMAYLLRQRGWLPLHASGVLIGGRGALFVGPSGAGKSTTAAAFHARGHLVIADDVGAVSVVDGDCRVRPESSHLRLLDDSRVVLQGIESDHAFQIDKYRFELKRGNLQTHLPLTRIYMLEFGERTGVKPISKIPALTNLSENTLLSRRGLDPEVVDSHLRQCASIVSHMRIHRLMRPRNLHSLPDLVRLVEDDIAGQPAI